MKLTLEEHKQIGKALKLINYKVCESDYIKLFKTTKNKKIIYKIQLYNGFLKNLMEEIMFIDHPKEATTDCYYGELQ